MKLAIEHSSLAPEMFPVIIGESPAVKSEQRHTPLRESIR
jgi:hypothetical protein